MDVNEQEPGVCVRTLKALDLDRLVKMDAAYSGHSRQLYLSNKLKMALESGVRISLGAEVDGTLVGAILGSVHYGEFGQVEPVAVLDTILVDQGFTRRHIGDAMLGQLLKNLEALRIERVRTEVGWSEQGLIGFLAKEGFAPAPRLVLERVVGGS